MLLDHSSVVPPGKPIPPASKQIQNSMNSYMSRAKSSIESTMSSAKSGDIKEKFTDSMSSFGDKMSQVMDKAKSTVQSLRTWCCLLPLSIGSVVSLLSISISLFSRIPYDSGTRIHVIPSLPLTTALPLSLSCSSKAVLIHRYARSTTFDK